MFGAVLFVAIGFAFIFFRGAYARFIFSFFVGIPAIRKREEEVLRWFRVATVIAASSFILVGILYGSEALSN